MSLPIHPKPSTNGHSPSPPIALASDKTTKCSACQAEMSHALVCERCGRAFCSEGCRQRHLLTHRGAERRVNLAVPVIAGLSAALVTGVVVGLVLNSTPAGPTGIGPDDFAAMKPVVSLTYQKFVEEFIREPKAAEARYFDRVIEIEGLVEITQPGRRPPVLLLQNPPSSRLYLECGLRRGVPVDELQPGDRIIVRGYFRGRGGPGLVMNQALYQRTPMP